MSPQKTEEKKKNKRGGLQKVPTPLGKRLQKRLRNQPKEAAGPATGHYTKKGAEEKYNTIKHSTQLSTTQNTTLHST